MPGTEKGLSKYSWSEYLKKSGLWKSSPDPCGQPLFLPTNPKLEYQYYSITLKASTCHEAQRKERVLLKAVGRWRRETTSHRTQNFSPSQISTGHLCPQQAPGLPAGHPSTLSCCPPPAQQVPYCSSSWIDHKGIKWYSWDLNHKLAHWVQDEFGGKTPQFQNCVSKNGYAISSWNLVLEFEGVVLGSHVPSHGQSTSHHSKFPFSPLEQGFVLQIRDPAPGAHFLRVFLFAQPLTSSSVTDFM